MVKQYTCAKERKTLKTSISEILCKNIAIEERIPQENAKKRKLSFHEHVTRLHLEGFSRGLYSAERNALYMDTDHDEDTKALVHDMRRYPQEWNDEAIEISKDGTSVIAYRSPRGLIYHWAERHYVKIDFSYSSKRRFPLPRLDLDFGHVSAEKLAKSCPDLVTYLWSRPLKQIPHPGLAGICLPRAGEIAPISHDPNTEIRTCYSIDCRGREAASRGIQEEK